MDAIGEAISVVLGRPLRTVLTALGTVLGVGAVVATTGIADTASAQLSSRFDALRATEVRVVERDPGADDPFPADVDQRLQQIRGVRHGGLMVAVPDTERPDVRSTTARLTPPSSGTNVIAATPGATRSWRPVLGAGRLYDEWHEERAERVALIGRSAASLLGITDVAQGRAVFIDGIPFSVIGIVDDTARASEVLLAVVIPYAAAAAEFELENAEREVVIDVAPGAASIVGRQAPLALRPDDPERLQALVPPDPRTLRREVEGDVRTLFYVLGGLALMIGSVAIANATLMNVVERRSEIGLRRALGATRRHIVVQVTGEAAAVGAIAGGVGTLAGLSAVSVTSLVQGWTPTIAPLVLVVAPGLGIVTGLLAGLVPSIRAAGTPPSATLRT